MNLSPRVRESLRGYLWASPWFLGFVFLVIGPLVYAGYISFTDWGGIGPLAEAEYVGVDNYARALMGLVPAGEEEEREDAAAAARDPDEVRGDELVATALVNTIYYAVGSVVLVLSAALALAMLLNRKLKGISVYRTVFFMPAVVSGVATMVMWRWVFNPLYGLVNTALRKLYDMWNALVPAAIEIDAGAVPGWLADTDWAMPALIIMSVWGCGNAMLIFLAGLQNVPEQLYEAAEIDGAGRLATFRHVTLPQLSPTILFNLVIGIIASFQVFGAAYLLPPDPGGPGNATLVFVLYLWRKAFKEQEMGYACALGWILFAVILVITVTILATSKRWVYYEAEPK